MNRFLATYRNYNTILIATNREEARNFAVTAFQMDPQHKKFISIVPMDNEGRVY
jgi:hypothetical protein